MVSNFTEARVKRLFSRVCALSAAETNRAELLWTLLDRQAQMVIDVSDHKERCLRRGDQSGADELDRSLELLKQGFAMIEETYKRLEAKGADMRRWDDRVSRGYCEKCNAPEGEEYSDRVQYGIRLIDGLCERCVPKLFAAYQRRPS